MTKSLEEKQKIAETLVSKYSVRNQVSDADYVLIILKAIEIQTEHERNELLENFVEAFKQKRF